MYPNYLLGLDLSSAGSIRLVRGLHRYPNLDPVMIGEPEYTYMRQVNFRSHGLKSMI